MKRWYLLTGLIFLTACRQKEETPAFDPPETLPAIQVRVSNNEPRLGEIVDVQLRVSANERLPLPPLDNWLHPSIELLNSESKVLESETGWRRDYHLQVTLFQNTNVTLFAETKVRSLDEEPVELELPFQSLSVQSVLEDENASPMFGREDLPDFRGPEAIRRYRRNLWISLGALLALLLLGAVIAWRIARRPKPVPPPLPPHHVAARAMEALRESDIWQKPDVDACAVELSFILRRYIEARFEIQAPEQTTEEFLETVEQSAPWSESEQAGLSQFFTVTDQIKYAAARPEREVLEDLLSAVRSFVDATAGSRPAEVSA
ncbi:MAG: DUF4381 family protein [Kiritimatiellae bacterium]|jgi:hypothetical protein|nr:DUF4381 family protein [Kiritimatiellia bacterium]